MRTPAILLALPLLLAAEPAKPDVKMSDVEKTLFALVNEERAKEKFAPLTPDAQLFAAARAHTKNMAAKEEMNHVLDGKGPADRVAAAGYDYRKCGENIARAEGASPADVVKGWMDSPSHRTALLHPDYADTGLGVAKGAKGETFYTQVFGVRRKK